MEEKIKISQFDHKKAAEELIYQLNTIINKNKKNINNIVVNGHMQTHLQKELKVDFNKIKDKEYFSIGRYNDIELIIKVKQLWSDDKIFLRKDEKDIVIIDIDDKNNVLL